MVTFQHFPWLTVCANCKRWRPKETDDETAWADPYISFPPVTPNVSHGLCLDCYGKLYPDLKNMPRQCRNGGGGLEG